MFRYIDFDMQISNIIHNINAMSQVTFVMEKRRPINDKLKAFNNYKDI